MNGAPVCEVRRIISGVTGWGHISLDQIMARKCRVTSWAEVI
jgi:hypothetical protein